MPDEQQRAEGETMNPINSKQEQAKDDPIDAEIKRVEGELKGLESYRDHYADEVVADRKAVEHYEEQIRQKQRVFDALRAGRGIVGAGDSQPPVPGARPRVEEKAYLKALESLYFYLAVLDLSGYLKRLPPTIEGDLVEHLRIITEHQTQRRGR